MNRLDYPNPIFIRKQIVLFNDGWQISYNNCPYRSINVPFSPESELSGIDKAGLIVHSQYKKTFFVEKISERIVIHFGAVDYRCDLIVNGVFVGSHVGGYTPFEFDITDHLVIGENTVLLSVSDKEQRCAPTGKQTHRDKSFGCFYTRTTGIWQNVWLEYVPKARIKNFFFYPDVDNCSLGIELITNAAGKCSVDVSFGGKTVGEFSGEIVYKKYVEIPLCEKHLWELGKGDLYDVTIKFENDEVFSYFGLRTVGYKGFDFLLNGKKTFQKLVLDQGYYPSGGYTAPTDADMQRDIDIALSLGFNGSRLHQKVFDPKFLYLCDKAGYMVWGEFASWGVDYSSLDFFGRFIDEWTQVLARDFNHPSIITWCPLNEVWGTWEDDREKRDIRFIENVYAFTKTCDRTRPCVDVSGGHHGRFTDLFDFHNYNSPEDLAKCLENLDKNGVLNVEHLYSDESKEKYVEGTPVNLSECGGRTISSGNCFSHIALDECAVTTENAWGYGNGASDGKEFVKYYKALIAAIKTSKKLSGFCYTQLYDVEQEQNGFFRYDRSAKLTDDEIAEIRKTNEQL